MALTQVKTLGIADDAVTGAKIADDQINSEHYVDGSIDNAHVADDQINSEHYHAASIDHEHLADDCVDGDNIADNSVGLAAMAGIARGKLIVGDSNGDPAYLAAGSNDQVLTMDANGDVGWEAAAGGTTINNATANELVTVASTTTELDAEANLTFDGNNLTQTTDADGEGIVVSNSGNTYNQFTFDANRSGANAPIGTVVAKWNGNVVGSIQWNTGADTTNKDDGWFDLRTAEGGSNTERLRIAQDGTVTVAGHIKQDGGFGINEPGFVASMNGDEAIDHSTNHKFVNWQNYSAAYNPGWDATNDKFTVPTGGAGKYLFGWKMCIGDNHQQHLDEDEFMKVWLLVNGSGIGRSETRTWGNSSNAIWQVGTMVWDLADADYVEMYAWHNEGARVDVDDDLSLFWGFRLAEGD